jgi:hypothetical protein
MLNLLIAFLVTILLLAAVFIPLGYKAFQQTFGESDAIYDATVIAIQGGSATIRWESKVLFIPGKTSESHESKVNIQGIYHVQIGDTLSIAVPMQGIVPKPNNSLEVIKHNISLFESGWRKLKGWFN